MNKIFTQNLKTTLKIATDAQIARLINDNVIQPDKADAIRYSIEKIISTTRYAVYGDVNAEDFKKALETLSYQYDEKDFEELLYMFMDELINTGDYDSAFDDAVHKTMKLWTLQHPNKD